MWIVWIVGLVLIGVGVYLWRTRFAGVGTARSGPPYGSASSATAGSDEDGKRTDERDMMC